MQIYMGLLVNLLEISLEILQSSGRSPSPAGILGWLLLETFEKRWKLRGRMLERHAKILKDFGQVLGSFLAVSHRKALGQACTSFEVFFWGKSWGEWQSVWWGGTS